MSETNHNISGGWLGTYSYRGIAFFIPAVRFEANFIVGLANQFNGTILDDEAGGEARANGLQSGLEIVFTKTYIAPKEGYKYPVEYQGTVTEDGRTMKGIWRSQQLHGIWEAHRLWSESTESEQERHDEANVQEKELATVGT